jgi:hypothetical protein
MILCPKFVKRTLTYLATALALQTVFIPGLKASSNWVGES